VKASAAPEQWAKPLSRYSQQFVVAGGPGSGHDHDPE